MNEWMDGWMRQKALEILDGEGATLLEDLRSNAIHMHQQLEAFTRGIFVVQSDPTSPIVHLRFTPEYQIPDRPLAEEEILREITAALFNQYQIMAVVPSYIEYPAKVIKGFKPPPLPQPSIRLVVNADHDKAELTEAARALATCAAAVLESLANNSQPASEESNGVDGPRVGVRTRRAAAAAAAAGGM
jgi:7-keto-8-aminopelargonate synthetase-like enzyme